MRIHSLGLLCSGLVLGGVTGWFVHRQWITQNPSPVTIPIVQSTVKSTPPNPSIPLTPLNFVAQAVQKVSPAVVRIDAERQLAKNQDLLKNPLFKKFFDEDSPLPDNSESIEQGTGSGLIWHQNGQIITNAHVVQEASHVTVTLKDGRTFSGKVIGIDPLTDVAVVQISAQNLPTVKLGSSETLITGDWAIAIGNPLGLDNSVTIGIISAVDRSSSEVGIPDKRVRFLQTDAAINPGNSGGPLLNAQGEVIGINTAIRTDAEGLGFAIPIETVQRIAQQLLSKGKADHPYLGVQMITLTQNGPNTHRLQKDLNLDVSQDHGVLIIQVLPNSPAEKQGLKIGDIIEKVGNQPVTTSQQVQEQVEKSAIGQPLAITIKRNKKIINLTIYPDSFPQQ